MRNTFPGLSIIAILLLVSGTEVGAGDEVNRSFSGGLLSPVAAQHDVAVARSNLEQLHAGYDRYTPESELAQKWDLLEARAKRGMSRGDLYLGLSLILAEIRCDHTKAELPKDMEEERNTRAAYLPFRFVLFDRKMYVDMAAQDTGLKRGDEILSIDGHAVQWWLRQIEPLVPVDGDATHIKPLTMSYSTEFMGPALDHFAPFLTTIEDTAELKFRTTDALTKRITVPRQTYEDFQEMVGEQRYSSNFSESVRFERLGDDAAYLAVDTFVNYRKPVDAMAHLAPYFESLNAEKRRKLIIDLRRNGGGSDDAQQALLRHLLVEPTRQVESKLSRFNSIDDEQRQFLTTWEQNALNPDPAWFEKVDNKYYKLVLPELLGGPRLLIPANNAYDGEIIVITGPSNSSGSTHLIATLKAMRRTTLVGERTGGAPTGATGGTIFYLTLPRSKIRIRIPAIRTVIANAGSLPSRNGIAPDVFAPMTAEAYFTDRDPALEAAKRLIK